MEKTTDYKIFKKHVCNRPLVEKNVRKIMDSILSQNLLHLRPILVDCNMFVIDGQHRLEAAERLGIEIWYQQEEKINSSDILNLNVNQLRWDLADYLNYHCSCGNQDYINLRNFMEKNGINLQFSLVILGSIGGGRDENKVKQGFYKFPDETTEKEATEKLHKFRQFIEFLREKTLGRNAYLNSLKFASAFFAFINISSVDFNLFMKRLPYRMDMIHPCGQRIQYLEIFREIYNYRNQNPLTREMI